MVLYRFLTSPEAQPRLLARALRPVPPLSVAIFPGATVALTGGPGGGPRDWLVDNIVHVLDGSTPHTQVHLAPETLPAAPGPQVLGRPLYLSPTTQNLEAWAGEGWTLET